MPFVFAVLGILLLVIAIQGTQVQAFTMLKSEFSGSNSFIVFAAAIVILGALAYIKPIRPIMFGMIGLVLLGLILANKGGFFSQLNNALRNPTTPDPTAATGTAATTPAGQSVTTLQQALPAYSPATTGNTLPAMPGFESYVNSLPAGDNSVWGMITGIATGYTQSGLPTYSTLYGQTNEAAGNVLGGAAGL